MILVVKFRWGFGSLHWGMRIVWSSGDVDSQVRVEPEELYARVFLGCRWIVALRARGSVSWQRDLRATRGVSSLGKGAIAMDVMFERVVGIDIGKATLTVCVRTPGGTVRPAPQRDQRSRRRPARCW